MRNGNLSIVVCRKPEQRDQIGREGGLGLQLALDGFEVHAPLRRLVSRPEVERQGEGAAEGNQDPMAWRKSTRQLLRNEVGELSGNGTTYGDRGEIGGSHGDQPSLAGQADGVRQIASDAARAFRLAIA